LFVNAELKQLSLGEVERGTAAAKRQGRRRRGRQRLCVDTETRLPRQQIAAQLKDTSPTLRRMVQFSGCVVGVPILLVFFVRHSIISVGAWVVMFVALCGNGLIT